MYMKQIDISNEIVYYVHVFLDYEHGLFGQLYMLCK